MMTQKLLNAALDHARECAPQESCGVVVSAHRRNRYVPCRNISLLSEQFICHPEDLAAAEDVGEIIAIVHSHPSTNPAPSHADLLGIEATKLPWLIVNPLTGEHTLNQPSGYIAPLVGREFAHGISDCYSLIRDYYQRKLGIAMPDFNRQPQWWLKGDDLYRAGFDQAGFVEVPQESLALHDVVIMRMASPVDNHGGIYIGDNLILQHVHGQLSSRDVYGGYWRKCSTNLLRHRSLV